MPVDGFVHISTLAEQDYFDFDAASVSLVGRRTNTQLRLGDKVRVQVAFVNVDRRELDFRLVSSRSSGRRSRDEKTSAPAAAKRTPRRSKEPQEPRRSKRR